VSETETAIALLGTEWPYKRPSSPSRTLELVSFWERSVSGDEIMRAAAAIVGASTGVGRHLQVPFDADVRLGGYATAVADALHAHNDAARKEPGRRAAWTGKELVEGAARLVVRLRQDLPVFEWEVAEAVGNSAAAPTS
jgi:hypothetical protein